MLTIDHEKVCYIIIKAREFDVKVEPADDEAESGSNPSDDGGVDVLEDYVDDPTYVELRAAFETLNVDELQELLALTLVGRGDFTAEEWDDAMAEAEDGMDERTIDSLVAIPALGDYIEEGFTALGHSCQDVDSSHL